MRAWKDSGGGKTYFLYDGISPVCELDEDGAVTAVNTFGADGLVLRTVADGEDTRTIAYLFDEKGNVAHRLDEDGTVLASDVYEAFGLLLTSKTPAGNDYDFANDPYGYEGQFGYYTDRETGLVLCTYRYYDPELGRWVTRDPIGYAGGMNVYGYCGNNPIAFVDQKGECWTILIGAGVGAVAGALTSYDFSKPWNQQNWGVIGRAAGSGALIGGAVGLTLATGGLVGGPAMQAALLGMGGWGATGGALAGLDNGGWQGALLGGVSGFAGGVIGGAATMMGPKSPAIGGAISGLVNNTTSQLLSPNTTVNILDIFTSTATGFVTGLLAGLAPQMKEVSLKDKLLLGAYNFDQEFVFGAIGGTGRCYIER